MAKGQALMLHELQENKPILVRRAGAPDWHKSRLEAVLGKYLQAGHPIVKGKLVPLKAGDQVEVGFQHKGLFVTFSSSVLQVEHRPVAIFTILRPGPDELRSEQRRKALRADALVPLTYEILGGKGLLSVYHTLALNLSTSGIVFNAKEPISPRSVIGMELQIPNVTGSITARGQVVSCSRILKASEASYKIRVRFTSVLAIHQERIDEYVRERRRYAES
jgi:c-di-GMP-binding flagellar brake protein YcgR